MFPRADDRNLYLAAFAPKAWTPEGKTTPLYSISQSHANQGKYRLHNVDSQKDDPQPLIDYSMDGRTYPLYTLADLVSNPHGFTPESKNNVIADLAERIAWRNTKKLLKRLKLTSRTEGLFGKGFSHEKGHLVASNGGLELCVYNYPNMAITEQGEGPLESRLLAELDGFFRYHRNHYVVLEVKSGAIDIDVQHIKEDVLEPLRSIYPGAEISYVVFGTEENLFCKKRAEFRVLKKKPLSVARQLSKIGMSTFFLRFEESREDFEKMYRHLQVQDHLRSGRRIVFQSKVEIGDGEVRVYATGDEPWMVVSMERS